MQTNCSATQAKQIMSEAPIPVLATGRTDAIGRMVIALLKPEYEGECFYLVVPLILSLQVDCADTGASSHPLHLRCLDHG